MLSICNAGKDSWESLGKQDQTSQSQRKSILSTLWKDWCWNWSSSTLATWCEQLTHWKRPWCWERLKIEGEEGDRGWQRMRWHHWFNEHELGQTPRDGRDREAWCAAAHKVAKCWTQLGYLTTVWVYTNSTTVIFLFLWKMPLVFW